MYYYPIRPSALIVILIVLVIHQVKGRLGETRVLCRQHFGMSSKGRVENFT